MITLTRITVSKKDSAPKLMLIHPDDIRRVDERSDDRDTRVKSLVIILRGYHEELVYVIQGVATIRRAMNKKR